MKKLLLIIATIISLTAKSQTSVYHPFPDSNAVWRESYLLFDGISTQYFHEYQYYIKGDTTINTNTYHKIYMTDSIFIWPTSGGGYGWQYIYDTLMFAFREDANKKVWVNCLNGNTDLLFYDFNLTIGDTINTANSFQNNVIIGIDSILIGTNYRKRYLLHDIVWNPPGYAPFIIEGIGSSHGFRNEIVAFFESGGTLNCFMQNGQWLYSDSLVTNCNLVLGFQSISASKSSIELFPNPFSDKINITIKRNEPVEAILYDITSRKIFNQTFTNSISINTEELSKGIYIYEVRNKNGLIKKGKVVKE